MPITFKGGKTETRTSLKKKVGSWALANWIEKHGKGVERVSEKKHPKFKGHKKD